MCGHMIFPEKVQFIFLLFHCDNFVQVSSREFAQKEIIPNPVNTGDTIAHIYEDFTLR